jgi:hypothetical protein
MGPPVISVYGSKKEERTAQNAGYFFTYTVGTVDGIRSDAVSH